MRKLRTFHIVVAALVLSAATLVAGCDTQQGIPADETPPAKCAALGFEDMFSTDPDCGKLVWKPRPDYLSVREQQLSGYTVLYYLYDEVFSENWRLKGVTKPTIQPYQFTHPTVVRLNDRDIVGIEVSEVCNVTLWERDRQVNLGCSGRELQYFTEITATEASVVYSSEKVAWMTRAAENAGRTIMFTISCLTPDLEQPDGSVYTGPAGCPAA